jgi:hypothetical protein
MVLLSIVQNKKRAKVSKKTPRHPADDCVGVVYDAKMFRINLERGNKKARADFWCRVRRAPVLVCVLYSFVFRKRRKMTLNGREAGVISVGKSSDKTWA